MSAEMIFGQCDIFWWRRGRLTGEELRENMLADLLDTNVIISSCCRDCVKLLVLCSSLCANTS